MFFVTTNISIVKFVFSYSKQSPIVFLNVLRRRVLMDAFPAIKILF